MKPLKIKGEKPQKGSSTLKFIGQHSSKLLRKSQYFFRTPIKGIWKKSDPCVGRQYFCSANVNFGSNEVSIRLLSRVPPEP